MHSQPFDLRLWEQALALKPAQHCQRSKQNATQYASNDDACHLTLVQAIIIYLWASLQAGSKQVRLLAPAGCVHAVCVMIC